MPINYQGSGGGVPRKTAKIFGKNADSNDMTVFGSTLGGNTVYSNDLDSIQSTAYETGWRDAVISNLNYPLLSDMNAVQHTLSQQIAYTLQHGIPEYDSGTTYYAYDKVQYNDVIYTALQDNFSNKLPSDTSYWATYYSPYDFLNKKQITNCVLEAPNGVCTLWQGRIVVASGIKYLIPNGTNSDGTLKNIEAISSSKVYNYPENDDVDVFLFLDQNGNTFTWLMRYTFIITSNVFLGTETGDAQTRLVYITRENQWYYTSDSGSSWVKAYICCVAAFHAAAQSVVYMLSEAPLHLFSDSKADIQQLTKLGFPTSVKTFPLALGASDSIYTAVGNGYIIFSCLAGGADSFVYLQGIQSDNSAGVMSSSHATLTNQFMLVNIPVLKGQKFQLSYYNIAPTGISFGIVGAVGEDN